MPVRDLDVTSPLLPGGNLVRAILDRFLMRLSDRGGASGLIGDRWANLCDEAMRARVGQMLCPPLEAVPSFVVERVVRLDDIPAIAAAASRRKLQNPDFLIVGRQGDLPFIRAADAKFSVETARAKQVSREVVAALAQLGPLLTGLLEVDLDEAVLVPGLFLCPDFSMTHLMLERRVGIVRTTVKREEVLLLPVDAHTFSHQLEGAHLMSTLHGRDGLPVSPSDSLLATLYYFRIARACIGCWLDETGPLLVYNDPRVVDDTAVMAVATELILQASSAYDLVLRWHARSTAVQEQRRAVDQVTALPISGKELRAMVLAAAGNEAVAPSVNRVRRRLTGLHRAKLRDAFGPLHPPEPRLGEKLGELAAASRALEPRVRAEAAQIIDELIAAPPRNE